MKLAVVPARAGSKRIPRKNIQDFGGKPMMAWSIEAAIASRCFDAIVVSTDDQEIAQVARNAGAAVPFMRPASLADDLTAISAVIAHAIEWFRAQGQVPEPVCCICATAPFISPDDIRKGLELLNGHRCDYAFSVTSYAFPIQRAIRINSQGRVEMFSPEYFQSRSQDLPAAFHDAAQFYWGRSDAWCGGKRIFSDAAIPVLIPRHRVQDIDTPEDWTRAEWMLKALRTAQ
jgi:N-acylneuraminate cytidylyltransferase